MPDDQAPQTREYPEGIHPRAIVTDQAGNELYGYVLQWRERHVLTDVEYLYILNKIVLMHLSKMGDVERGGS